jgi:hypothetical protein
MFSAPFLAASLTYALMLAAYYLPRRRFFHIPVMVFIILFDIGMPFYLYSHRDWWHRLIEQQELFSFLVWMHFGLLITLYTLYAVQIHTAGKMLRGTSNARSDHRAQGKALLLVRGLAILTGAILANPAP